MLFLCCCILFLCFGVVFFWLFLTFVLLFVSLFCGVFLSCFWFGHEVKLTGISLTVVNHLEQKHILVSMSLFQT